MQKYNFVCPLCQKNFTSKHKEAKYCSPKCRGAATRNTPETFWSRIDKNGPNGCWIWLGYKNKFGYGRVRWNGETVFSHRLACELMGKPIPEHLAGCHKCDHPFCCNPDHVYPGTHFDNMKDRKDRGHYQDKHGTNNPNAKLNVQKAQHIRELYSSGSYTYHSLSKEFSLSITTITKILMNRLWV